MPEPTRTRDRSWLPWAGGAAALVLVLLAGAAFAVVHWSGASLGADDEALARVHLSTFGGTVTGARVVTASGKTVPLVRTGDLLTPAKQLASGQQVRVTVDVRRPGIVAWALGKVRHEHLTLRTPQASVASRWIDAGADGTVRVPFDGTVERVSYVLGHQASERRLATPGTTVSLGRPAAAGSVKIAASARPWLRLDHQATVDWFPKAKVPVAIVSPRPGGLRGPAEPIRLTFSVPVRQALGGARPGLSPSTPGRWTTPDSHTLVFTPSGYGTGFGQAVHVTLPRTIGIAGRDGRDVRAVREVSWTSEPGSTLRLQQLLAQAGYLPLDWAPSGTPVPKTRAAQSRAASQAPDGSFSWRYANTPKELKGLWTPGKVDVITRGAVMMFQDEHHLAVDAVAGAGVWKALLDDTIAGKRHTGGYNYVYVHRKVPQRLTLWHAGHTVLTSPGNTGVPAAPTELGTFPVFEHLAVTTMSGTNPDGSHYNDPGIRWVSYFNGGDALHSFNRASFGTPQSLGCVELPLATAAKVWPYTPIGTLVTIEQ